MNKYSVKLDQIISNAAQKIKQISDSDLNHKPSPAKWSKKQILGHLIDSAYNNQQRIVRAEKQGNMVFLGYEQDDWVAKNNYQDRGMAEVLQSWVVIQNHFSFAVAALSDDVINKKTKDHNFHVISMNKIPEGDESSLSYLVWDYTFHLEHHLAQIIPDYEKINDPYRH